MAKMAQETPTRFLGLEDCRIERSTQKGREYTIWRFEALESLQEPPPQAHRVDMPAETVIGAHFHDVDQYQVFFGVPGAAFQRQPIEQVLLHYSDAYSTYGPFSTLSQPMNYLTLRSKPVGILAYMPQDRDKLIRRGRRNIHVEVDVQKSRQLAIGTGSIDTLIEPDDDHVAAFCLSAGPKGSVESPDASASSGGYLCVLDGAIKDHDDEYGRYSVRWINPKEPPIILEAGETKGFCALALHLPSPPTV